MQVNQHILPLYESTPVREKVSRHDHLTFKANRGHGRHGWLRLTPAYSVHLVEELVSNYTASDLVLDPFCGTGTTALVCAQAGVPCHTLDINPFLIWLANTKCAVYSDSSITTARAILLDILADLEGATADSWTPAIKDITKWWDNATLRLLAYIFTRINAANVDVSTHDLLCIVFCRVMIETSSVNFGHQSMSFKKQKERQAMFVSSVEDYLRVLFERASLEVLKSAQEPMHQGLGKAFLGDSRDLQAHSPQDKYTVVITSPPYPNRMSYIRELRPYMYWLGYLESGRQAGELDWQAIGGTWGCATSNLMRWSPEPACKVPYSEFQEVVERITTQSRVLGLYVAKYFEDIVHHIRSLSSVLAPNARVYYVVGNSKFYDIMLHTEKIYASIFRDQGFVNVNIETIRKRTSKKELFEYVVSAWV